MLARPGNLRCIPYQIGDTRATSFALCQGQAAVATISRQRKSRMVASSVKVDGQIFFDCWSDVVSCGGQRALGLGTYVSSFFINWAC